jgi:hypothetical protein
MMMEQKQLILLVTHIPLSQVMMPGLLAMRSPKLLSLQECGASKY